MMGVKECNKKITLKVLRKRLKLNQTQLAQALGVRQATISDWERGIHKPLLTLGQVKVLENLLEQVNLKFNDLPDDFAS